MYTNPDIHFEFKDLDLNSSCHFTCCWSSINHLTSQSLALLPVIWYKQTNKQTKKQNKTKNYLIGLKEKMHLSPVMLVSFLISSSQFVPSTLRYTDKIHSTILLTEHFRHKEKKDLPRGS